MNCAGLQGRHTDNNRPDRACVFDHVLVSPCDEPSRRASRQRFTLPVRAVTRLGTTTISSTRSPSGSRTLALSNRRCPVTLSLPSPSLTSGQPLHTSDSSPYILLLFVGSHDFLSRFLALSPLLWSLVSFFFLALLSSRSLLASNSSFHVSIQIKSLYRFVRIHHSSPIFLVLPSFVFFLLLVRFNVHLVYLFTVLSL